MNASSIRWYLPVLFLLLLAGSVVAQNNSSKATKRAFLHHQSPDVRASQARLLGEQDARWAVNDLIELLGDENEQVRTVAHESLQQITGESFPPEQDRWRTWFNETGRNQFSPARNTSGSGGITGKWYLDPVTISTISVGLLLFFVVTFTLIGGYQYKKLKEVMRDAEDYVSRAEEVTQSSDRFSEELEQKKVEMREFLSNLKEEKEGELERHTELLEENSAQRIREEMSSLREQAEKEVEHTLNDLREDVKVQLDREMREVQDEIEESLNELHDEFQEEAEAQRLFLEASMYDLTDKPDEALEKYDRVIDMKSDHHLAIQRKARVLKRRDRYEMALKELQQALDHSPESPSLLYDIARTYALMSRKERMLEFLEKSISIDPEYKDEALNDEAFEEFWNDREFKDLAEA